MPEGPLRVLEGPEGDGTGTYGDNGAMDASAAIQDQTSPAAGERRWSVAAALALGMGLSLATRGYQFGQSNHNVYLVDALHRLHPELLANDWFTTATLQYHSAFGWLTEGLMRLGALEAGFLVAYLLLVVMLHLAWLRLVRDLGGSVQGYLLSVVAFYLSAGGTGLGYYQFLQDAAFLPSNVASVAMLWGIVLWIEGRFSWAGLCLGMAALFHLNYAVVGLGMWVALGLWRRPRWYRYIWGTLWLVLLAAPDVIPALGGVAKNRGGVPLNEFVDLYVHLRHPHHYDPSSWPIVWWICFLWPVGVFLSVIGPLKQTLRNPGQPPSSIFHPPSSPWREAGRVYALFMGLQVLALIGAGIWYVSETLIQMSLYRFSIYPLLLGCIAAGIVLEARIRPATLCWVGLLVAPLAVLAGLGMIHLAGFNLDLLGAYPASVAIFLLLVGLALVYVRIPQAARGNWAWLMIAAVGIVVCIGRFAGTLGISPIPRDDEDYMAVCRWVRTNTAADAVFLVPPQEFAFRYHAQRAIWVNFKGIPQLSSEIPIWRDRLREVLEMEDLRELPRPLPRTIQAIHDRYESRSAEHLFEMARRHSLRYVLVGHELGIEREGQLVHRSLGGAYFLYDVTRLEQLKGLISGMPSR